VRRRRWPLVVAALLLGWSRLQAASQIDGARRLLRNWIRSVSAYVFYVSYVVICP